MAGGLGRGVARYSIEPECELGRPSGPRDLARGMPTECSDGSHEGTDFTPMSYTAEESRTLYFCGCKRTGGAPLCDGSHNALD